MSLWMLLGEARSKIAHLADSLLQPETGERLMQLYLAKGVHATTAIEGNTLSEDEVVAYLDGRLELPRSQEYLAREVDNIIHAYNRVKDELFQGASQELTPARLKDYNRLILESLELDEGVVAGEIHEKGVGVGRYLGPPSADCEYLLARLCEWLNGSDFDPPEEDLAVPYTILKAIMAHLYMVWIHPFGDGNGRVARLLELRVLLESGLVPTPASHLLSSHYNTTRDEYYRRLDASSRQDGGDPARFLVYAVGGLVDGLRDQLRLIWVQLYNDRWEQYVYQQFGETTTAGAIRRRQLVLDLSKHQDPVPKGQLREISPKVAAAYAGKTEKTLTRDINALLAQGLITRSGDGFHPHREKILALLPERAPARP